MRIEVDSPKYGKITWIDGVMSGDESALSELPPLPPRGLWYYGLMPNHVRAKEAHLYPRTFLHMISRAFPDAVVTGDILEELDGI